MALRLPLDRLGASPGGGLPLAFFLGADLLVLLTDFWWVATGTLPPNEPELRWNLTLAAALAGVAILWALARALGWVGSAGGPGLVLASYGLLARLWTENLVILGGAALDAMPPDHDARGMVSLVRALGLFAVALGLALAVAAEIGERRAQRETPSWLRGGA